MSAVDQTLTLPPILPAEPLVLCSAPFLHTLATVEREVANIAIADAQSAQAAANILQRLTTAGTVLEKARADLKAPFIAKGREIDAAAKAPADRIEAAKRGIKAKVTAFNEEQERIAAAAERARQVKLARLEALRREEERQAEIKAAELARQAAEAAKAGRMAIEPVCFDDLSELASGTIDYAPPKTETEKAIEAVRFAPVIAAPKPAGIAQRVTLVIESVDVAKLPETFYTREAKMQAIKSTFCTGWKSGDKMPECPGVVFRIDRQVVSTGRDEF